MIHKILVATDSFKGSLSSIEVTSHIAKSIRELHPLMLVDEVPMADGGEGTVETLESVCHGERVYLEVHGPDFKKVQTFYLLIDQGETAVMEMASASGLTLLEDDARNPLNTTTYGVGEMIVHALEQGCKRFIIGIGGSATNDGGIGMLNALGYRFVDEVGKEVKCVGGQLHRIVSIDDSGVNAKLDNATFRIACDVNNPLLGPKGASYTYGSQKGASPAMLEELEDGMKNYAAIVSRWKGSNWDRYPGSGAAGGLGYAFLSFLNSELLSGYSLISNVIKLEERIEVENYDLIITGEGRMDAQSTSGKLPAGMLSLAIKHKVPIIAIVGSIGEGYEKMLKEGMLAIYPLANDPQSVEKAIKHPKVFLTSVIKQISFDDLCL